MSTRSEKIQRDREQSARAADRCYQGKRPYLLLRVHVRVCDSWMRTYSIVVHLGRKERIVEEENPHQERCAPLL